MLEVDLHAHSLFSQCGLHTILELLTEAKRIGLKGLAITDHGLTLGGKLNSIFYERFVCPFSEIRLIKGIECNIVDELGKIDLPVSYLKYVDIVLLGIHPNTPTGNSREYYTSMLLSAIEKNPSVDIITHPNDTAYPLDYVTLARGAKKKGVALELNNSRILYNRSSIVDTQKLVYACKDEECYLAVCSDTHAIHELGRDESVAPLLAEASFPEHLLVTKNSESAFSFIDERRENKRVV